MMRLERGTGHQTPAHDDTPQSSFNHLCLREVVISIRCHHKPPKRSRTTIRQSVAACRARAQIKGLIIAAFLIQPAFWVNPASFSGDPAFLFSDTPSLSGRTVILSRRPA
jgi:hypothetical protein